MGFDNPIHIFFVVLVVLLVFGAKRLPELGRSLGGGMRGFRDALSTEHDHAGDGTGVAAVGLPAELPAPAAVTAPASATAPLAAPAPALLDTQEQHAA